MESQRLRCRAAQGALGATPAEQPLPKLRSEEAYARFAGRISGELFGILREPGHLTCLSAFAEHEEGTAVPRPELGQPEM
jgi:hypothetical protein